MAAPHDEDPSDITTLTGTSGVARATGAARPEALEAAEHVDGPTATDAAAGVRATEAAAGVTASGAVDPLAALTEALATGAIDAEAARTRLIAEVVRAQAPPGADPAVWRSIEAEVAALLAGDPTLADLLRP